MPKVVIQGDLLSFLPNFSGKVLSHVEINGEIKDKVISLTCFTPDSEFKLFLMQIIKKEDKIYFESALDLIKKGINAALSNLTGTFQLEIIYLNIFQGFNFFEINKFSVLLQNKAKNLQSGESVVFRFCSIIFVFVKKGKSDWAKITLKNYCKIFSQPAEKLDLELKKTLLTSDNATVIYDMSRERILDLENEEQSRRLARLVLKNREHAFYYVNNNFCECISK